MTLPNLPSPGRRATRRLLHLDSRSLQFLRPGEFVSRAGLSVDHCATYKLFEDWVFLYTVEELALPLLALLFFSFTHCPLTILNYRLFSGCGVHVALIDSIGDLLPGFPGLEIVLLFNGSNLQRRGLCRSVIEGVDDLGAKLFTALLLVQYGRTHLLCLRVLNAPLAGPLPLGCIDGLLLLVFGINRGGKTVGFATDPASTAVLDLARISRRRLNVGCAVEFDVG